MTRKKRIMILIVIVATILSVAIFAAVRHNYPESRSMGGESLLLLLPLITYVICRNITDSLDVLSSTPSENLDEFESQVISSPRKLSESKPKLRLIVNGKRNLL